MPLPVYAVGQVLGAADVDNWLLPAVALKTGDQSVTSSTALVNDGALTLPVSASWQYRFECYLDYEGGTQGASDLKWTWSVPSGGTLRYQCTRVDLTGAVSVGTTQLGADVQTARTNGAGNLLAVKMLGSLLMSVTAGNLTLQWAQGTVSATATIMHAQSYLMLNRIG